MKVSWPKMLGDRKGFTLLELAIVFVGLALVSTAAIPYFIRQAEIAAANKTAKEISTIQEAAKWHYVSKKVWPESIEALQDAGLLNSAWSATNPWGSGYSVSSTGMGFTVTTTIPSSAAGVLLRALLGVSSWTNGNNRIVNSAIPVPGQEASITNVTNLAASALNAAADAMSMAQSSAVPPYGSLSFLCVPGNCTEQVKLTCPSGSAVVGINQEPYSSGATVRGVYCQRIAR